LQRFVSERVEAMLIGLGLFKVERIGEGASVGFYLEKKINKKK